MIKRTVLIGLEEHLTRAEMTVLIGPRQVGKTYLMQILQKGLEKRGEKTVFLSLDNQENKKLFVTQNTLVNYISLQVGEAKAYIFIDEVQRKEDAGLFLKGIYDMNLPYKFIISGSGSLDLKARVKESMAGRKQLFEIEPISFEEFVNFKTNYQYATRLQDFFSIEASKTRSLFEEYMMFGGYPKVVLAQTLNDKVKVIDEIYKSYIERDITDLLGVEKPDAFSNLLKILASQIGNMININELSSTIGISTKTVQHYLWYLEETFIIKKLTPFYRNVRSEITKAPVYYFYDTGMRNSQLGLFGLPSIPASLSGHLFENVIFNTLRGHIHFVPTRIHFWRSKDKAEVDFVVDTVQEIIPVEVKYSHLREPEMSRSFRSFIEKYMPKKAYIVHLGGQMEYEIKGTKIYFIPFYKCDIITKPISGL